jgi:putative ABC transport system permease protein
MPDWRQEVLRRLAPLNLDPIRRDEIAEELCQHLDDRYSEVIERLGEEGARSATLAELDTSDLLAKELQRIERLPKRPAPIIGAGRKHMFLGLPHDLRYALRVLRKNPTFTLIASTTLALGIGASTAIFSVVNAVLLRPLPYAQPERLVMVEDSLPSVGFPRAGLSEIEYVTLRNESSSLENVALGNSRTLTLTGGSEPERVIAGVVSSNYFDVLGTRVQAGRGFAQGEDLAENSNVAVLSHSLWLRRFSGDQAAIGNSLTLNGNDYLIVGVLPAQFKSPLEIQGGVSCDVWITYGFTLSNLNRGSHFLSVIGRLREGITPERALAETETIMSRVVRDNPTYYPTGRNFSNIITPLTENIVGSFRSTLLIVLGAVLTVLLIATVNVANLLLARGESRHKEIAIRLALGARRSRIVIQLLVESLVLAVFGGTAGLLLAQGALDALISINPGNLPRIEETSLDSNVLLFTAAVSLITALGFGIAPALHSVGLDLNSTLKEGGRSSIARAAGGLMRKGLVVAEMALAIVLLVGSGLLIRSFQNLRSVDTGFNPKRLLTMRLSPSPITYSTASQVVGLYERINQAVSSLPAVDSAAVVDVLPISGNNNDTILQIDGRPFDPSLTNIDTDYRAFSPAYSEVMGLRLTSGRGLADTDREDSLPVALINETLARRQWPSEDPLGKRLRLLDAPPTEATTPYLTVVGVMADSKNHSLSEEVRQEISIPFRQAAGSLGGIRIGRSMSLVVRTSSDPAALVGPIRQRIFEIDRSIPITQIRTMEEMIDMSMLQPRFNTILLSILAAVALGLGAVGIYGVISCTVAERTHELGLRMALGAQSRDVVGLVLRQGMKLVGLGIVLGVTCAFGLTRIMSGLLFGVTATDPVTFVAIPFLLSGVALLACLVPARRATRMDPLTALRCE